METRGFTVVAAIRRGRSRGHRRSAPAFAVIDMRLADWHGLVEYAS